MEQLNALLKEAKKKKGTVIDMKNLAVKCQLFELASELRQIEREKFPDTREEQFAKKVGKELNTVFRMVDLNISEETCWLIYQTLEKFKNKKGKFSIHDAANLKVKQKEIFNHI